MIGGDGIGPEVMDEAVRILEAVETRFGFSVSRSEHLVGGAAIDATGHPLPPETVAASEQADAILFLSLLSGRNPDYLIEYQVQAAPILKKTNLEVISTGYILIESGNETAVARVSKTKPMERDNFDLVLATAQAGEMLGNQLIYLTKQDVGF